MKVTDKLLQKQLNWSFEYFPPKTVAGKHNLFKRLQTMKSLGPTFSDITWGASGSTSELSLEIAEYMFKVLGMETSLHVTCTNLDPTILRETLNACQQMGLRNILALRGDPPKFDKNYFNDSNHPLAFSHAIDLVQYMKEHYNDYFCIGVAGYPEGHIDNPDLENDLMFLKQKVDAGADYIVTQLFYNVPKFLTFVNNCRDMGITCPILPGIMPIQNYKGFQRMTSLCKTNVPSAIEDALQLIKDDDALVKEYGVALAVQMCQEMMQHGITNFHFYTLNLETSTRLVLEKLHFCPLYTTPALPWSKSLAINREMETVRPIYWSNRQASYIQRTATWDEFPNGRWGNPDSCAYGELDGYGCQLKTERNKALEMWGYPTTLADIGECFVNYLQGKIPMLPWCDVLSTESGDIVEMLIKLNKNGFFTINSQPAVNGLNSNDPVHGWGPGNGYVYQRAYVECFTSSIEKEELLNELRKDEMIHYYCVDKNSKEPITNHAYDEPIALTWGVFPGKEVMQPTIMQKDALMAWKGEAFELWREFRDIYEVGRVSWELINEIYHTYSLVTVVYNDYTKGAEQLFQHFKATCTAGFATKEDSRVDLKE